MLDHGLRLHRYREGLHQVILAIATVESSSKAQLVVALSLARYPGGAPGDTGNGPRGSHVTPAAHPKIWSNRAWRRVTGGGKANPKLLSQNENDE